MPADSLAPPVDFASPPVNEAVLSIQFAPIPKFGLPHLGLYWQRIREEFSRFESQPVLASVTEQFDVPVRGARFGIQLISQPEYRCWFLNDNGTRLLQVQQDRFIHNWRQVSDEQEPYPRYPAIRETLKTQWTRFTEFLASEMLDSPQVNQLEVTYVNHIDYNKGWKDYGDLQNVVALWSGRGTDGFLPSPERVSMDAHYRLPDKRGRLYITAIPVIRARDSQEVLQLTLTVRGAPKSSSLEDILEWMDFGRMWVVKGFADFTAKEMHKLWGRKL